LVKIVGHISKKCVDPPRVSPPEITGGSKFWARILGKWVEMKIVNDSDQRICYNLD
jgi:hypothetical protein